MITTYKIVQGDFTNAGNASSAIKQILKQLNISPKTIKHIVIALYEAEVNIVAHAWEGEITAEITSKQIRIILEDKGPGIPNIDLAMTEGFSTASKKVREMGFGAGMGLPNIKRNCDEMYLTSEVNVGTRLEMITYFNK